MLYITQFSFIRKNSLININTGKIDLHFFAHNINVIICLNIFILHLFKISQSYDVENRE